MRVENDTIVEIQYLLQVKDGDNPPDLSRVFNARFLYGREPVIPALEKAIFGLEEGEEIEVTIPPEQGFGQYDEKLVNEIPLSDIRHPHLLKKGQIYEEMASHGHPVRFVVRDIKEDSVIADFNHPAAGKELLLKARVMSVRAASALDILQAINLSRGGG